MQILLQKKIYKKYHSCNSTFGRYIHLIYRIETNAHISPSFYPRDFGNVTIKYYHRLSFHRYSHYSMIWPHCCIAAVDLIAATPEAFLHWQPYLMVSASLFLSTILPTLSAQFCCKNFISFFVHWYICAFLGNFS